MSFKLTVLMAVMFCLASCGDADPSVSTMSDYRGVDVGSDVGVDVGDEGPLDVGGEDSSTAEDVSDPGDVLEVACSPDNLMACAYLIPRPTASLSETVGPVEVNYQDVTGETRSFAFEVRFPDSAGPETPVVIWSHGGSSGKDNPSLVANGMGDIVVAAGYVFIAVAHYPRSFETYETLCGAIGQSMAQCRGGACQRDSDCSNFDGGVCSDAQCRYFKPLNWDRPNDVIALLDRLSDQSMSLQGKADLSKIVYAGHSAGAGSALMVAGAVRAYGDTVHLIHDSRPIAFISGSPQGPEDDGFAPQSFTGEGCRDLADDPSLCLTRPHFFLTGAGDDTSGHTAEDRRASFSLLPNGDKFLFWNSEEGARHTTFEHKPDSCENYDGPGSVSPDRCQVYLTWQHSSIIAFLDATTLDLEAAREYLNSENVETLSKGAVEWELR